MEKPSFFGMGLVLWPHFKKTKLFSNLDLQLFLSSLYKRKYFFLRGQINLTHSLLGIANLHHVVKVYHTLSLYLKTFAKTSHPKTNLDIFHLLKTY